MGHAAVAYILYSLSTRWRDTDPPGAAAAALAGVGSLLPDLVDKPLSWYLGVLPTGRTLVHSLVVVVPLVVVVFLFARSRGYPEQGAAFCLGVLSHPLADALPALWTSDSPSFLLWPLLSVEVYADSSSGSVSNSVSRATLDPFLVVQAVVVVVAIALWRIDGYPGLAVLRRGEQPG